MDCNKNPFSLIGFNQSLSPKTYKWITYTYKKVLKYTSYYENLKQSQMGYHRVVYLLNNKNQLVLEILDKI